MVSGPESIFVSLSFLYHLHQNDCVNWQTCCALSCTESCCTKSKRCDPRKRYLTFQIRGLSGSALRWHLLPEGEAMNETSDFSFRQSFINTRRKVKKKNTSPLTVLLASICYLQMRHTETPACSSETRGLGALLPFTLAKITASSESAANRGGETVNYEGWCRFIMILQLWQGNTPVLFDVIYWLVCGCWAREGKN